jgi:hypothetical protein
MRLSGHRPSQEALRAEHYRILGVDLTEGSGFCFWVGFGSKVDKVPLHFIVALCDELAVISPCVEALTQSEEMFGTVISH